MTDLSARQVVRNMLQRVIPLNDLEELNREYDLHLAIGATFHDALNAALLKKAAEGDQDAVRLVQKYGLE